MRRMSWWVPTSRLTSSSSITFTWAGVNRLKDKVRRVKGVRGVKVLQKKGVKRVRERLFTSNFSVSPSSRRNSFSANSCRWRCSTV